MPHPTFSRRALLTGLGGAAALALAPMAGGVAAAPPPDPAADPAVINDWNATAVATILTDAGLANAQGVLAFSFVQAAVYNAVVGITRRYELYRWKTRGPATASPQAAAAAAAHRVLLTYFGHLPAAQARLATAYEASIAQLPDGPATWQGLRYGERAAEHLIALRADDGRNADLTFDMPLAPGVWRPTPPAVAPYFSPWLCEVTPLLLDSPSQFRPPAPPALTSATYAAEFDEVKALGAKASTVRTPTQTETVLFISSIDRAPLRAALRDLATRYELDISDRARLFAAVDMSAADAIIACWDCKFHYGLWRPITAIRLADEDGNPATGADPAWESLVAAPAYPDYVSGLCSVMGAATQALTRVLDTSRIDLTISSPATNTTRYYEFAAPLCADSVDARVFAGIHFRTADALGMTLGQQIADWALDRYFMPR